MPRLSPTYILTTVSFTSPAPEGSRCPLPVVAECSTPRTPLSSLGVGHPLLSAGFMWHVRQSSGSGCACLLSPLRAWKSLLSTPIAFLIGFSLSPLTGVARLPLGLVLPDNQGTFLVQQGMAFLALPAGPHVSSRLVAMSGKQQCGQHWERWLSKNALITA